MQSSTQYAPNLYPPLDSIEITVLHVIWAIQTENDPMFKPRTSFKDIILGKGPYFFAKIIIEKLCLLQSVNLSRMTFDEGMRGVVVTQQERDELCAARHFFKFKTQNSLFTR